MEKNILGFATVDFNPEWLLSWYQSVPDEMLREEIEQNPRVNKRVIDNILFVNGIENSNENIDPEIIEICALLNDNKGQFIELCGLALLGSLLRKIVDPSKLANYVEVFGEGKVQTAIRLNIDYQPFAFVTVDKENLLEFVNMAGVNCIVGWSQALSPFVGANLRMLFPKGFSNVAENSNLIEPNIAFETVKGAANIFRSLNVNQEANAS